MRFSELRKDYLELIAEHGEPYDMTGGFVDAPQMMSTILNPTRKNAMEYLLSVMQYGFQFKDAYYHNADERYISVDDCDIVKRIYDNYIA